MIKGFVFDFDGLILDTEMPQFVCWKEVYARYGLPYTLQDWWKAIGTNHEIFDPARELRDQIGEEIDIEGINHWVVEQAVKMLADQPLCPGVKEFLEKSHVAKIPMTIASSSTFEWVAGYLTKFNLTNYFQEVFTSRDVKFVKPNPDLYLLATKYLHLTPDQVMAFEDSLNGLKAANAAGIFCTVIPSKLTRGMDFRLADRIIPSFVDLDLDEILTNA